MDANLVYVFGEDSIKEFERVCGEVSILKSEIDNIISKEIDMPGKSVYYLFPYLFNTTFGVSDKALLLNLCVASVLCLDFCLFSDKLFDKQIKFSEELFYSKVLVDQKFIMKMMSINNTEFWTYYYKYYKEYVASVKLERDNHFGKISNYDWKEFSLIARGKQALSKLIPASMGCLVNDLNSIEKFEKSIDLMSEATQLYDDLKDWKDDFKNKRYSWILNKIITENNLERECEERTVAEILFKKGYDTYVLDKASNLCEQAILSFDSNDVWVRYVRAFSMKINRLMFDLIKLKKYSISSYGYLYRNKLISSDENDLNPIIYKSLSFIIKEYKKNLPELKHWMLDVKEGVISVVGGDIFQRSLLLNLLLEINEEDYIKDNFSLSAIIDSEINYIIDKKTKEYDCGWIYIDGLFGNCPDLDTLSEIIRVDRGIEENIELRSEVNRTLEKVFSINNDLTSFKTWVLYEDEKDYDVIKDKLSMSGEIDVNANFMSTLCFKEYDKYKNIIRGCLGWIYSKQNEEGTWASTWYVGNYYCGYVLSKTFYILSNLEVIEKYLEFLLNSQNENGSWGSWSGNPLETAYAILSLVNIGNTGKDKGESVRKGVKYLLQTINDDGHWYGCEFIKMGSGKINISEQALRYRSATLTTMFCISALVKANNFIYKG